MLASGLLETCLRKSLADADVAHGLKPHAGKVLKVSAGPATVALRVGDDGLPTVVHRAVSEDACVRVPFDRVLGTGDTPVRSEGDSDLLAAFADVFSTADLGVDAFVERSCGPLAGSLVANLRLCLREWGADSCERLGGTVTDWLTQESGILPDPAEGKELTAGIERFAARVENLRQQVVARPVGEGS